MTGPRYVLAGLMIGVALVSIGCAKVAANKTVPGASGPRAYPYEPPDLYDPTYPSDAVQRDRMRRDDMRDDGALFP